MYLTLLPCDTADEKNESVDVSQYNSLIQKMSRFMQAHFRKCARDGWAMFDQPRNASDYEHTNAQQKDRRL